MNEELGSLAEAYLTFLITRGDACLKTYLCLDFVRRRDTTEQLRLIQRLPHFKSYGIGPESHLWTNYPVERENGEDTISPFQFDVSYRNPNNPLETEFMRITINRLVRENGKWKIDSIITAEEMGILLNLIERSEARLGKADEDQLGFV